VSKTNHRKIIEEAFANNMSTSTLADVMSDIDRLSEVYNKLVAGGAEMEGTGQLPVITVVDAMTMMTAGIAVAARAVLLAAEYRRLYGLVVDFGQPTQKDEISFDGNEFNLAKKVKETVS
jgi:hypothetical protein